jgi:putative DNA primase/helicase
MTAWEIDEDDYPEPEDEPVSVAAAARELVRAGKVREPPPPWMDGCPTTPTGLVKRSYAGLAHVLEHHPELVGALEWCQRRMRIEVVRDLPWHKAGDEVRDVWFSRARNWLERRIGQQWSKETVVEAAIEIAHLRARDKLVEYLRGLTWDGVPRMDRLLIDYAHAPDTELVMAMTRAFCIGAVRRALQPGCKHDCVLVLEGPQGRGKSQLVRALAGEWGDENLCTFEGVAAQQHVAQGPWIVEIAELTAVVRGDPARAKQFLSLTEDRFRAPYDRVLTTTPRRCVFVGTINPIDGWLSDPTGGRRYWPVTVRAVDLDGVRAIRDQLWAEAVAAHDTGEPHWLRGQAEDDAQEAQADRYQRDPWHDDLAAHMRQTSTAPTTGDLHDVLGIDRDKRSNLTAARIGKVMTALGYEPTRSKYARTWVRRVDHG